MGMKIEDQIRTDGTTPTDLTIGAWPHPATHTEMRHWWKQWVSTIRPIH